MMTIGDVEHFSDEKRAQIIASYAPAAARMAGWRGGWVEENGLVHGP
jgi:hypothetical protein